MTSKVPRGYPSREITDNSARMLVAGFQQCPDLWSFRISMILNIEICIKKLTLHLLPETVSSTAKSHLVLKFQSYTLLFKKLVKIKLAGSL